MSIHHDGAAKTDCSGRDRLADATWLDARLAAGQSQAICGPAGVGPTTAPVPRCSTADRGYFGLASAFVSNPATSARSWADAARSSAGSLAASSPGAVCPFAANVRLWFLPGSTRLSGKSVAARKARAGSFTPTGPRSDRAVRLLPRKISRPLRYVRLHRLSSSVTCHLVPMELGPGASRGTRTG